MQYCYTTSRKLVVANEMTFVGKLSILLGLWATAFLQPVGAQEGLEPDNHEISRPGFVGMFDLNAKHLTGDWGGVRTALEDSGIKISLSYQQQGLFNFHGGRDTNDLSRFHGSYDLKLTFDTGKMGLCAGVMAAYLVIFPRVKIYQMFRIFRFRVRVAWFLVFWIGWNIIGAIIGGGEVAWMAHIGGFLAGALFAYRFRVRPLHQVLGRA